VWRLLERWGAAADAPQRVQAPPGVPVATVVARGEAALGFQQLSELLDQPGIAIVAPLPPGADVVTVFAAALGTAARRRHAAAKFLAFLASADADAAKRRHGMEPVAAGSACARAVGSRSFRGRAVRSTRVS
jgi:molybdate transport system substrate-binding protein